MAYAKGLEGVIAGETAISNVEGDIGRLSYRGYGIEQLVTLAYEEVLWLVIFGELPTKNQLDYLGDFLNDQAALSDKDLLLLRNLDLNLHPMRMLQSLLPVLHIPHVEFATLTDEAARGLAIIARLPALIATYRQLQLGNEIPPIDKEADYLTDFMWMFTNTDVNPEHVEILKVVQILQMEHSFNAGTFASRVTSSTLAPIEAVFSAAVGALFGILHGGADEAALNDAKRVGSPEKAAVFVAELLENKQKLMGMGHREYRKVDPRSVILKPKAEQLCKGTEFGNTYATLQALEIEFNRVMQTRGKQIWANLEFYKGVVYEAIGIPSDFFTSLFAMSRSVGWLAHFIESREDNRIVRPKADYVGVAPRTIK